MRIALLASFVAVLAASACGGSGTAEEADVDLATGNPDLSAAADLATRTDLSGDMTEGPPTFNADIVPILENEGCLSCHMTDTWDSGETLASAQLVSFLTSTKSEECPSLPYVTPGDPASSYLYQKVKGAGSCFVDDPMPDGSPGLDTKDADRIEAWILDGAPSN